MNVGYSNDCREVTRFRLKTDGFLQVGSQGLFDQEMGSRLKAAAGNGQMGLCGCANNNPMPGTGGEGVIRPGELQRMSAGHGIQHSEYNASQDAPVHFLQIWIQPDRLNAAPDYAQQVFPAAERSGRLQLLASPDGAEGSLSLRQDARVHGALLAPGESVEHVLAPGRRAWLQVVKGGVSLNGQALAAGDGAGAIDEPALRIEATVDSELLLFDLP